MNLLGTQNAGHTIIQQKEIGKNEGVVLAYKMLGNINKIQFVTWLVNTELKEYFWGHYYFDDLRVALEDFEKRN